MTTASKLRLRQFAFAARALTPALADLQALLSLEVAHRDPAVGVYGLENAVLPIGDQFIEIISPVQEGTSAGRYLARRGGDTSYMLILQSPDARVDHERVSALGVRTVETIETGGYTAFHYHPSDAGGVLVSLDTPADPRTWMPAGDDWQSHVRTERALGIAGVEISAADPEAMARHWQAMLGAPENEPRIALADADLRFVPVGEKGPGVDTVRLRCSDADAVRRAADLRGLRDGDAIRWCGTRLELA